MEFLYLVIGILIGILIAMLVMMIANRKTIYGSMVFSDLGDTNNIYFSKKEANKIYYAKRAVLRIEKR